MARKFPKTLHAILEKLDLEHTLYLHLLFVEYYIDSGKYRFRNDWDVDDFCCCYNDMMNNPIDDNVQDCNRGLEYFMEQWYEDVPSRYRTAIRDIKLWAAHDSSFCRNAPLFLMRAAPYGITCLSMIMS